ncbi:MAG: branched-chain amino acid ABC transporter permease [Clostridiales bacterium]|nr:branched-chain amino acid ABC transporter permease [Clostridiales bacterium]
MKKKVIQTAIRQSLPITCSYLFVSMAYGIVMEEAGFAWFWSLFTSLTVYTGAFQFVLVTFLSSGASIVTVALTALFMNSRQVFYGLSFIEDFRNMGKKYPYMIHTMTDETYAVNCALTEKKELFESEEERRNVMFYVALFSRISWMFGAVLGGVLGQVLPMELEGIDFCMTALFVVIFIDQWKAAKHHVPALLGLGAGILCLLIFGAGNFILPALILVSGSLLLLEKKIQKEETDCE